MAKRIQTKKLFFLIAGVVLVVLCYVVLLGNLIKWAVEFGGSAIFGARTELARADLRLKDFSLNLYRLQIANKNSPWTNLLEIGRIRTSLDGNQFALKRFIMNEVTVENIQVGTRRTTSGALPVKVTGQKKSGAPFDLQKAAASLQIDPTRALAGLNQSGPIASTAEYTKIQKDNESMLAETKQKVNNFKPDEELKSLDFAALNTEAQDLPALQEKLKTLEKISKQFEQVQQEFGSTQQLVQDSLRQSQENLAALAALKDKDLRKISEKLKLPQLDTQTIGRNILGPKVTGYADTGLYWLRTAQQYMPPKKAKVVKPVRFQGEDIIFSNGRSLPKFLIRKIALSGIVAPSTLNAVTYSGQVLNITSEPARLGQPMTIDIGGKFVHNPRANLSIKGTIDHTQDIAEDSVDLAINGYELNGQKLWDEKSVPLVLKNGTGSVNANFKVRDGEISGRLLFTGQDLVFEKIKTQDPNSLDALVAEALSGAKKLNVEVQFSGSLANPDLRILTNADALIAAKVNKIAAEKMAGVKKALEDRYNQETGALTKSIQDQANSQSAELNKLVAAQQSIIDAKQKELQAKQAEINQKIEELKNEQVNKVKNSLQDSLQKSLPAGIKL